MRVRTIALVAFFLFLTLFLVSSAEAKGWRGIVPLHSTRADVERLLGQPEKRMSEFSDFYRTPNETVIIDYAKGLPCGIGNKYSRWRVPRDTVTNIFVTPNRGSPLSQLSIDESKYKSVTGGHTPSVYYVNELEGERLRVFQNEVMDIGYFPAAEDAHLECPGLPKRTDTNCEGLVERFDWFGNLTLEREKQRLDNFVIALMDEKGRQGYIVAYAGKIARAGEAKHRAERYRKYLVNVRRFPPGQLKAIDGGYREKPAIELYVVPVGVCPPIAGPTIDPRDVQIIMSDRGRKNRRSSWTTTRG
jgi:hypothetical protein